MTDEKAKTSIHPEAKKAVEKADEATRKIRNDVRNETLRRAPLAAWTTVRNALIQEIGKSAEDAGSDKSR